MFLVSTRLHESPIHGLGVFAAEPIRAGQVVWQFDARLDLAIPAEEAQSFPPAIQLYFETYAYAELMGGRRMLVLCADHAKHVNHADEPNLLDSPDGTQEYAARDIRAGEELTCNYFTSDLDAAQKLGRAAPRLSGAA